MAWQLWRHKPWQERVLHFSSSSNGNTKPLTGFSSSKPIHNAQTDLKKRWETGLWTGTHHHQPTVLAIFRSSGVTWVNALPKISVASNEYKSLFCFANTKYCQISTKHSKSNQGREELPWHHFDWTRLGVSCRHTYEQRLVPRSVVTHIINVNGHTHRSSISNMTYLTVINSNQNVSFTSNKRRTDKLRVRIGFSG